MNILLIGNPNVGKSVVFSRITGTSVNSSNYPGTTVEFTEGHTYWNGQKVNIIDVPGTYTLNPTNKAEEVAVNMLKKGDLVVNVVDATNLERNLNLTLQLLEYKIPVIVALNLWDETKHKGISIDIDLLSESLGVPVIPTVATKGNGIKNIVEMFGYNKINVQKFASDEQRWAKIGTIIGNVQQIKARKHTFRDYFDEFSIRPLTGTPIAALILALSFTVIRFIGESLIGYVTEPFFENIYKPILAKFSIALGAEGFLHDLLVGQLIGGQIDFEQSFGLFTTGVYIPLAAVLPYILAFYFVLSLMEDTGYLTRLAVLTDNIMHKVGLHGFSIIPMILGIGCNVPAALSTRSLESKREKFIASTLMAIAIPCMSQIAMIIGLLSPYGNIYVGYVFVVLFVVWIIVGLILNKMLPGFSNDLLIEIPPYRIPSIITVLKKLSMRIRSFLIEAIPFVLLGVFIVNILYVVGVFDLMALGLGPALNKLFGLPEEAISVLLMGFLRKDLAMSMLAPLNLTVKQLVIASTILAVYFPCIATFAVLVRELGIKDMLKSTLVMLLTTLVIGTFLNHTFSASGFSIAGWLMIILAIILTKFIPKNKKESISVN